MNNQSRNILIVLIIVVVAALGYMILNKPDTRNPVQKVGDAIHELPNGTDNAARELQDRTPGQRLKDDVKDATDGNGR